MRRLTRTFTTPWLMLLALCVAACGPDAAKVDDLFLKVTSDSPAGGGRLASLRILFSKGDVRYPATTSAPDFNPALGTLDPVAAPVYLSLSYEGVTFGDGSDVTLQVLGKDGAGQVVTAFEAVVDVTAHEILAVHLDALPADCDDDGDGFLDCSVSGCCAGDSVFADCAPGADTANPWGDEDECDDDDEVDNDCQGGDVVPVNSDADPVADCKETACGAGATSDATVYPDALERCDGKDNDCDAQTDEGVTWTNPAGVEVGKGEPCGFGACAGGTVECGDDGAARCSNMPVDPIEGCDGADDGVDDNCNGQTDEGCEATDVDGDGVSPPDDCNDFDAGIFPGNPVGEPCCDPAGQGNAAIRAACDLDCDGDVTYCEANDLDHDGFTVAEDDCDDDPSDDGAGFPAHLVHPGAAEKCGDGVDQDCIGGDLPCAGLTDGDNDGWPAGDDCDDGDDTIRPDAAETCNGKDDDCDNLADDGNPGGGAACGSDEGECVRGLEVCSKLGGAPGIVCPNDVESTTELCNGKDDDCDGDTDEDFLYGGIAIGDACDGVGACGNGTVECAPGRTDLATCSTNPNGSGAEDEVEVCDALDNDCDGDVNEDLTDVDDSDCDRDGVCGADLQLVLASCTQAGTWTCDYSSVPGYQAGVETLCDNKDNDCDGGTDEDITFVDQLGATRHVNDGCDGSDLDSCSNGLGRCDPGDPTRAVCDESNAQNQPEICDDADNDCDGKTDEDYTAGPDQVLAKALSGATFASDNGKFLGASCGTGTCGTGTVRCNPNNPERLFCQTPSQPSADNCDALDNDCNGTTDDRYGPGGDVKYDGGPFAGDAGKHLGQDCGTGACSSGTVVCSGAFALTCDSLPPGPVNDLCDDVDNDCNGTTDDRYLAGFTGAGKVTLGGALFSGDNGKSKLQACGTGTCAGGEIVCDVAQTGVVCDTNPIARTEQCEGADDSCNGTTDEGFANLDGDPLADCVDADMDGDGVNDDQNIPNADPDCAGGVTTGCNDNCPITVNADQADHESDAIGDACDPDDDNDGTLDASDACVRGSIGWTSSVATDHDGDGCQDGDAEDADDDNDGVPDPSDLCPRGNVGWTSGAASDYDLDGCQDLTGTDEDPDDDNDGVLDGVDACARGVKGWTSGVGTVGSPGTDWDGDGCRDDDVEDPDDDNDGRLDGDDACDPDAPNGAIGSDKGWTSTVGTNVLPGTDWDADGCQDALEDQDDDNDTLADELDRCDPDFAANDPITGSDKGWVSNGGTVSPASVGTDYDRDGCQDSGEDQDDDDDAALDGPDRCDPDAADQALRSETGWTSDLGTGLPGSDYDNDGCKDDASEDTDDDGDGISDAADRCDPDPADTTAALPSEKGWTSDMGTVSPATVGTDYDQDGCRDAANEDTDDDDDGLDDTLDQCDPDAAQGAVRSDKDWTSDPGSVGSGTPGTDYDVDGCQDAVEDGDDDNDTIGDAADQCDPDAAQGAARSETGWTSDPGTTTPGTDYDADGCRDAASEDDDDDDDGLDDAADRCDPDAAELALRSDLGWTSDPGTTTPGTDYDVDGCRDAGEDLDDDDDDAADASDLCDPDATDARGVEASDKTWTSDGGTTTPGTDYDLDGCRDETAEDDDDDNDGLGDAADQCDPDAAQTAQRSEKGWTSDAGTTTPGTDYDLDGCKDDAAEDGDDDGDGALDDDDLCDPDEGDKGGALRSDKGWTSNGGTTTPGTDYDLDGCQDAAEDDDDDDDTRPDDEDDCDPDDGDAGGIERSETGWISALGEGTPGTDYDLDGCKDDAAEDSDDDNDTVDDGPDQCDPDASDIGAVLSQKDWDSDGGAVGGTPGTDYDLDGCKDDVQLEDGDDDNDGVSDEADRCDPDAGDTTGVVRSEKGWTSFGGTVDPITVGTDYDLDGCKDDAAEDTDDDNDLADDSSDQCDPDDGDKSGIMRSAKDWASSTTAPPPVGTDWDADGCRDADEDDDDDDDTRADDVDLCDPDPGVDDPVFASAIAWSSTVETDYDRDGCRDSDEDADDDQDDVEDQDDLCDPDDLGVNDPPLLSEIGPFADHDSDGCFDDNEDEDDDNDSYDDVDDLCPIGAIGWVPGTDNDYDTDGCRDTDEDEDDDNDQLADDGDKCDPDDLGPNDPPLQSALDWMIGALTDNDLDGCKDDVEDLDDDNDTIPDDGGAAPCDGPAVVTACDDNCRLFANALQTDTDDDGLGDACDPDIDNDGVDDEIDNCPSATNPGQENADFEFDTLGDACDPCTDADDDGRGTGTLGNVECEVLENDCADGPRNYQDLDDDNKCHTSSLAVCQNGNTTNCADNCPEQANATQVDANNNGIGDACDVCSGTNRQEPFEVCGNCIDDDCSGATNDTTTCVHRRILTVDHAATLEAGMDTSLTFDHAFLVATGRSTASGNDVRLYHRNPTTGVFAEIARALDPGTTWNAADTTIWFKTVAASTERPNRDYYLYTGVAAGSPLAGSVFHFVDGFDRGDNASVGAPWVMQEVDGGSTTDVDILDNSVNFTATLDNTRRSPSIYAPIAAVTTGRYLVRLRWNWARAADDTFAVVMQIGSFGANEAATTSASADAAVPATGVLASVAWGRGIYGLTGTGTNAELALIVGGTKTTLIPNFDGSSDVDLLFALDTDTVQVDTDGDGPLGFTSPTPISASTSFNSIRMFTSRVDPGAAFTSRKFDMVSMRRVAGASGAEYRQSADFGAQETLGPACFLDTASMLSRYAFDDPRESDATTTEIKDTVVPPLDLVRDEADCGVVLPLGVPCKQPVFSFAPGIWVPQTPSQGSRGYGLAWFDEGGSGSAFASASDTKLTNPTTGLQGTTVATAELVVQVRSSDAAQERFLFDVYDGAQHRYALSVTQPTPTTLRFMAWANNATVGSWTVNVRPQGLARVALHLVYDLALTGQDRFKLYRDGFILTADSRATPVVASLGLGTAPFLSVGNDMTDGSAANATIQHLAFYRSAFAAARARANAVILQAQDDR